MAQHGSRDGTSLTRTVFWCCMAVALCGLMTACVSDVCPGDQIMIEETCIPAAVATKEVQNRRNLRATQAAGDEGGEAREPEQRDRSGSPRASPSP